MTMKQIMIAIRAPKELNNIAIDGSQTHQYKIQNRLGA